MLAGRRFAILTAGAWERHFGKRFDAIGSTAWMRPANGTPEPVEIIGVLAPGVLTSTPELDSLTDALVLTPRRFLVSAPDERCPAGILRLRPGVSLATAQRSIDEAVEAARTQLTESSRGFGARLFTLRGK